jgi:hypothetical protein
MYWGKLRQLKYELQKSLRPLPSPRNASVYRRLEPHNFDSIYVEDHLEMLIRLYSAPLHVDVLRHSAFPVPEYVISVAAVVQVIIVQK